MLVEASELGDRQVLETDLCVIGAGAAGITMARALTHSGIDVTLLESGGFEFDEGSQTLYAGEVSGNVLRPGFAGDYLLRSRLRYFGGTTNHWSGFCLPLEPDDFAVRDWIPESGWPFDADALQPFYGEAARVCEIDDFDYDPVAALRQMQPDYAILDRGPVRTRLIHRSTTRFGKSYRKELVETPTIRVVTGANVTELRLDAGRAVGSVHAATLGGRRFTVRARAYVLACGSIENARLLLASNQQRPKGLGNHNDLVGRYFMEHPWGLIGYCVIAQPAASMRFYRAHGVPNQRFGCHVKSVFMPTAEALRKHRIANFYAMLQPTDSRKRDVASIERYRGEYLDVAALLRGPASLYRLFLVCEQTPNRDSRVTLSSRHDALGMPRVNLKSNLVRLDRRLPSSALRLIGRGLGQSGFGRLLARSDGYDDWQHMLSPHQMGTTRAHSSPKHGVVNADLKLHDLSNLYVAGASVFTTSGAANPTFSIVALALRLAAHLETKLRS